MTGSKAQEEAALTCECTAEEITFLPCAKKTIEHAGLKLTDLICVTEEGVAKNHQFKLAAEDIDLIARRTRESLSKPLGVAR